MKEKVTRTASIPEFEESMKDMTQEQKDHVDNQMEYDKVICTSCEKEIEVNTTNIPEDDDDNYFCQTCWDELAPVMKAEAAQITYTTFCKNLIDYIQEFIELPNGDIRAQQLSVVLKNRLETLKNKL